MEVDRSVCIGSGVCAGSVPEHFALRGGRSTPLHPETAPDDRLIGAADSCPVEAISVIDPMTGEVIAPVE
ncbi:ferredoxin [Actinocorallia herbida]|uniref:ferredoxin n=1 Tax=Actinocorallia herbida TaxID=58109 RepID=UPI001B86C9BA|nr:ferredoxin [Actinocorallia herbida]